MSPKHKTRPSKSKSKRKHYRRIATEEAFSIPEQMDAQRELLATTQEYDPDLFLWKIQTDPSGPVYHNLLDLFEQRLRTMDEYDVDMHLLALTSTGVQMMSPEKGTAVAAIGNDRLHDAIQRYPDRFAGLATIAPQDPAGAVKEIERAITKLKLSGVMINSHTNGEYSERAEILADSRGASPLTKSRSTFTRALRFR